MRGGDLLILHDLVDFYIVDEINETSQASYLDDWVVG